MAERIVEQDPESSTGGGTLAGVLGELDRAAVFQRIGSDQLRFVDHRIAAVRRMLAELPHGADELLLRDDDLGEVARRVEQLRRTRTRFDSSAATVEPARLISVRVLADGIGVSEATARAYLERGLIPGARKADPTKKKSRWLIPADAPARYLQQKEA